MLAGGGSCLSTALDKGLTNNTRGCDSNKHFYTLVGTMLNCQTPSLMS